MTDLVLTGFHVKMRDLIGTAIDLGWSARQDPSHTSRGKTTVVLHSYDGTQTIRATPVRQINEAKLETMRRKVVKYADPVKRFAMAASFEQADAHGRDPILSIIEAMPTASEAIAFESIAQPEPEVVSERPWLAKKAADSKGGTVYESPGVIERTWSDGSLDYVCSVAGCGWANPRPRSVSAHYGGAHTAKGETPPAKQEPTYPGHDYFEAVTHREYRPQQRLVLALSDWLAGKVTAESTFEEWAVTMLTWAHERPDLPDVEPQKRAEMTAEDVLERIRDLVGAPLASRLSDAEAEAARQAAVIAGLEADVMARDAAIERLREERRALSQLLADES